MSFLFLRRLFQSLIAELHEIVIRIWNQFSAHMKRSELADKPMIHDLSGSVAVAIDGGMLENGFPAINPPIYLTVVETGNAGATRLNRIRYQLEPPFAIHFRCRGVDLPKQKIEHLHRARSYHCGRCVVRTRARGVEVPGGQATG